MARPKIAAGEVGQVQVTQLTNGKWRARARMRNDPGELVQLRAEGVTEGAARDELLSRAKMLTTHTKTIVTAASTIHEAVEAWLTHSPETAPIAAWKTRPNVLARPSRTSLRTGLCPS